MKSRFWRSRRRQVRAGAVAALLLLVGVTTLLVRQQVMAVHSAPAQTAQRQQSCPQQSASNYYALKQSGGFVLARADRGTSGQPLNAPQSLASFGNGFGLQESDAVFFMQLSPDGCYLAIDGTGDHGEQVWIYDIRQASLALVPANVLGNFLNWLPAGSGGSGNNGHTFLYRPMLPLGPDAPRVNGAWNPGLWIVDAASGAFRNIDIHVPSAFIVDAAPSPDGSTIIYSTSPGLGMGSDTWMMNGNESTITHLFSLSGGAQSIAGLFAWSPDGSMIAYERLSDSSVPFLPAGLWVMNANGSGAHLLAQTDGGHGYTLTWSPDSRSIAYIARTNNGSRAADYTAQSLQCAVAVVNVASGASEMVATPAQTGMQINDHPQWIANGAGSLSITFTAYNPFNLVLGGSPRYWSASFSRAADHLSQSQVVPLSPGISSIQHVVAIGA